MRLVARVTVALTALGAIGLVVVGCEDVKWEWTKGGDTAVETGPVVVAPRPRPAKPASSESAESVESAGRTESSESAESMESAATSESAESTPESAESAPAESGEPAKAESEAPAESAESQAVVEAPEPKAEALGGPWYLPRSLRSRMPGIGKRFEAEAKKTGDKDATESEVEPGPDPEPATPAKRTGEETEEGATERAIPERVPLRGEVSDEPTVKLQTIVLALLEQGRVDARVTQGHIEEARRQVTEGESTRARTSTFEAIRSASFVRAGLPTVLARQCLDRAVIESEAGRTARAVDAIKAVKSIASKLPLKCTNEGFTRWASQATDALEDGDPELARDIIGQMMGVIGSSEAEDDLDRLGNALSSCLFAIDRDALTIAGAELDEANALVFDVIQIAEGD